MMIGMCQRKQKQVASRIVDITNEIWTSSEAPGTGVAYKLISTSTIQPADKNSVVKVIPFRRF